MTSDGMKVIEQFINPPVEKNVQQQLNQLWLENKNLFEDVNEQYKTVYELDAERLRLNENQLDELENEYLQSYKDARDRLQAIQDETAKFKLEFINGTDKLHYGIEEGARLNRQGDKWKNEFDSLKDELALLKQIRAGLGCADEYIRKLREGIANQKDIVARAEQDLKNKQKELENARKEELHKWELVSVADQQSKAL